MVLMNETQIMQDQRRRLNQETLKGVQLRKPKPQIQRSSNSRTKHQECIHSSNSSNDCGPTARNATKHRPGVHSTQTKNTHNYETNVTPTTRAMHSSETNQNAHDYGTSQNQPRKTKTKSRSQTTTSATRCDNEATLK